ncbi:MAG: hypothetical protein M0R38_12075 [Bacteroidia bacterium]|nr:hypothetical protein [Bacteroidia bacterium]
MQWGISLNIVSDFDSEIWGLPPPSHKRWLTKMDGTKILNILYHFQYMPQSWKEWQRVSSIKVQIQKLTPSIKFIDYEPYEITGRVYTITELGKHFTEFVKYQKPLYPKEKSEFMRSLTIYAMRLHYENMLHFEAVMAMALNFNIKCVFGYKHRELNRKVRAIFELDRSSWKIKLSDEELKQSLHDRALKTAQIKRDKSQHKRDEAMSLKANGKTLQDISNALDISLSTVRRYVSK